MHLSALRAQDMRKATGSKMPPLWAIVCMVCLGFNEFVAVATNPILLASLVALGAFIYGVYRCACQ